MEWTANNMLDRYRCADFVQRLHLYMQYPDLRNDFIKIDREELHANLCYAPETCQRNPSRKGKTAFCWSQSA